MFEESDLDVYSEIINNLSNATLEAHNEHPKIED